MVKILKNTPFWNVLRRGSAAALALIVVAMSCFVPISAADEPTEPTEPVYSEGLDYTFSGSTATVTGPGTWTGGELRIPPQVTVDGVTYSVTAIGASAFKANTSITSLVMPSSVTSVGSSAFENCTSLTSVSGGFNLDPGSSAFKGCVTLSSVDFTTWLNIEDSCLVDTGFLNMVLPSNIAIVQTSALPSTLRTLFISSPTRVWCYTGFADSFESLYYSGTLFDYCDCFYYGQRSARVFQPGDRLYVNGELIGIVNAKYASTSVENIGYAIPSNVAIAIAENIIFYCDNSDKENVQRPILGIIVAIAAKNTYIDPETGFIKKTEKIVISSVSEGSVAQGIFMVDDVVKSVTLGDVTKQVTRQHIVIDMLLGARVGDVATFVVERNGQEVTLNVTITEDCLTAY